MKDIARLTGLGLATISSYFNGGNVREKNRVKIEKAIEELHYEVNEVARGLKTNATKTIGVVIPELNNIFCAEIITGMEDILRSHGYATIVCDCRTDKKLEQEAGKIPDILAARSAKELTRHLMGLEKRLVVLYCCHCLNEMMEERFSPAAVRALCSAVTEEFLAAMYLCSLLPRKTEHKNA